MSAALRASEPLRVLIVDDDVFVGRAVACILQQARGAQVYLARNADQALPTAIETQPHLIVADINMPGMSVLELCRHLHTRPETSSATVYLLTGMMPGRELLAEVGQYVRGVLSKPPDPVELLAALDACGEQQGGAGPA